MLSEIQLPLPIHFINCNMFMPGASSIIYLSNNKFLVLSFHGFVQRDNPIIAVRTGIVDSREQLDVYDFN